MGDVVVDTRTKTISRGGEVIDVTPREYGIFEFLMLRRGEVVSRTEIESHVYDDIVSPMSNVVDRAVCSLRRKLGGDGQTDSVIQTRRGHGYIIHLPAS